MTEKLFTGTLNKNQNKTKQTTDAYIFDMSIVMGKPAFCICENKDADQLRSNCAADLRLCFRFTESAIPLLPTSEISSL